MSRFSHVQSEMTGAGSPQGDLHALRGSSCRSKWPHLQPW